MWADSAQAATMLRLKQVMANTSDRESRIGDDSEDRDSRFFSKQMLVDIRSQGIGSAYRLVSDERPFGFEFVRGATFREINFGEYGLGTVLLPRTTSDVRGESAWFSIQAGFSDPLGQCQ
jgi:DEAD/DEAH box helicase domain-containing protein